MRVLRFGLFILPVVMLSMADSGFAQSVKGDAKDKAAIAKNADAFVEAFHSGDAKAIAGFWTLEGEYTDQTGKLLKGREAIEASFKEFFADNKGLKLRIDGESLRFVTADVAIEEGMTAVWAPGGAPPSRVNYTIVHVKKNGEWYFDSVRDTAYTPPSNFQHLRPLEWLMGVWASDEEAGPVERLSVSWGEEQNFIHATFSTTLKNVTVGRKLQWIGYDPIKKAIRSWMFDSTGGFGEGAWSQEGKTWTIQSTAVLPDGKKLTATYTLTPVDVNTISLQATGRTLDGEKLPDSKAIKLKRVE